MQLEKKTSPTEHPQEQKSEAPSLHGATSHWLHENYIPKIGCHYFWPGLIALTKNTLTNPTICDPAISLGQKW
jgi:hypothetical protein